MYVVRCEDVSISIRIEAKCAGMRLDRYIREHYSGTPQSLIEKLLRVGKITLNGEKVASKTRLIPNQLLMFNYPLKAIDSPSHRRPPQAIVDKLLESIVFEDDNVVVFNKPANLSTQGGSFVNYSVDSVLRYIGTERGEEYRLTHRIDKHTTGVLVVAKSRQVASEIALAFKNRKISKEYVALVWGVPPKSRSRIESVVGLKGGLPAITDYDAIASYRDACSVVVLNPTTGHKHQLRIHMSKLGSPIIGDDKYGNYALDKQKKISNLCLHARAITIPGYKKICAPIPGHMYDAAREYSLSDVLVAIDNL